MDTISLGGLHKDDFEWASKQYEAFDYAFVSFLLDVDGYHWKVIYLKNNNSTLPTQIWSMTTKSQNPW